MREDGPLLVSDDMTVFLDTGHRLYEEARNRLSRFAELVKSPGVLQTYRITPISLWNAASAGISAEEVIGDLRIYARFEPPANVLRRIRQLVGRYGQIRLELREGKLILASEDPELLARLSPEWENCVDGRREDGSFEVRPPFRGIIKQLLIRQGYPVIDLAGYEQGESLGFPVKLKEQKGDGTPFFLRDYQEAAAESFYCRGSVYGGNGIIVLPCGAGKTIVGLAVLARIGCATLILTGSATSVRQWKRELTDKTNIPEQLIGEYYGDKKEVLPITIATYQILTHRRSKDEAFRHLGIFSERNWGLIIYDEVHLLPAPVFRVTADIQAKRRLGLTATLIREDGREKDVFSLIGPKRFELSWKSLEHRGWISPVICHEVRVPMNEELRRRYASLPKREQIRIAAENPAKIPAVGRLLAAHKGLPTLILGQYLEQLEAVARHFSIPLVSGKTPAREREEIYERFRRGKIPVLALSKVANFAVDLPNAAVAVQISGSFGSRQEEAQRLGRILRPKEGQGPSRFFSLITEQSCEQEFALKRQLFLLEQGYQYRICPFDILFREEGAVK